MRKHLALVVSIVALSAAGVFAYFGLQPTTKQQNAVILEPANHDFGTIKPAQISHTFKIHNQTQHVIRFDKVVPGCGCTVVKVIPDELAPGESASAICDIDLRGRRGAWTSGVMLLYRELDGLPVTKSIRYLLKADLDTILNVEPKELDFALSVPQTKHIRLVSTQPDVRIAGMRCDHVAVQAKVSQDESVIDVTFDPTLWKEGEARLSIDIETTCETQKRLRVPIFIVKNPRN